MENHQHESAQSPFEDIKNNIKTYRSNGHFVEAARLIEDLPKNFRCSRVVAIEAAQLYLVQGQFRLAAETCDNVSEPTFADLKSESFALSSQDEDAVAFELLRAYIWIGRFSKLKTALKIAQRLGSAWNLDKPVIPGTIADSSKEAEDGGLLISSTNEGLEKEALGRNIPQISEYRVLMVFYYWKIMVVAAEQGLLDESATKAAALMPISSLRRALQVMNRLREARFLVYFEIGLIKTPEEAMQQLQGFLKTLDSDKWDTERALTLAYIFELQLQSSDEVILAKAQDTFEEAQKIFNKISHAFGNIDLDLARVSFDRTISAGEKFVRKTSIVDRYFQAGHYQNGIRCLTSAVSHETLDDPYVGQLISAIKLLQQKVDEVGSEILQQLALIHSVCQASLNASEYGFVLKALEPYYANVPEEIGPKNHSNIAMAMAMVYGSFGSNMKALKAAEESLEIAKSGTSYETCSDAALLLGRFRLAVSEQYPTESAEAMKWLSSAMDILKEWIEKDSENGYINGEIQKCLLVGGWENMRVIRQSELKSTPVEKPWIERVKKLLSSPTDVLKQNDVIDLEIRVLMRQQNFLESSKLSADYLNDLDRLPSVSPRIKAQAYGRAAIQLRISSWAILSERPNPSAEALQLAVKQRWSSLDLAYKSLQLWRQTNGSEAIIIKTNFFGDILSEAVQMIPEDSKRELLSAFLDELRKTEIICDEMRRSVIPIEGLTSLMNKRLLVAKRSSLKLYNLGVDLALRLNNPAEAWIWLQKGKSRAFSDSLGAKLALPEELLRRISNDPTARELLKTEQMYLDALNEHGVNHILAARELASVRKRMAEYPPLAEIARIRDGALNLELSSESLDIALSRTNLARERVKFIDWYVPPSTTQGNSQIICFVRTLDGTTRTRQLSISATQVETWRVKAFTYPDMADHPLNKKNGNRLLQEMNALLDGLTDCTEEGDLLVLSPSGQLNSIPLHALFLDKRPLIERNLVVYASSAAMLSQCLDRSASRGQSERAEHNAEETTAFFAVYEEPLRAKERHLIFNHIETLSKVLPGRFLLGPEVTKSCFLKISSTATWVHYHGHASYCKEDVLQSSLILSNGKDLFEGDGAELPCLGRDELSVVDIFNTTMSHGGVHFTIVACESGAQDLSLGDEPLGIIPALLHAGATSVLGCQWPIKSSAGRAFSEAFYAEVRAAPSNQAINLARALSNTVGKMRRGGLGEQYKQAYCWAPFTMHGLWFFPGYNCEAASVKDFPLDPL